MQVYYTKLEGCVILEPKVFPDNRGYFFESFNQEKFEQLTGYPGHFVQDNQSSSAYGVIRGLHLQQGEFAQAKLVRVLEGKVLDVAVDLREGSPSYRQWVSVELSADNKKQLYVPRGFAHGFSVLSDQAVLAYKCDNFYHKDAEGGLRFDDPFLNIDWQIPVQERILSDKDLELPYLQNHCL